MKNINVFQLKIAPYLEIWILQRVIFGLLWLQGFFRQTAKTDPESLLRRTQECLMIVLGCFFLISP